MEMMQMSILVAYASKHGATKELAERISENLRNAGLQADARVVGDVGDLGSYERVVVGSAHGPLDEGRGVAAGRPGYHARRRLPGRDEIQLWAEGIAK